MSFDETSVQGPSVTGAVGCGAGLCGLGGQQKDSNETRQMSLAALPGAAAPAASAQAASPPAMAGSSLTWLTPSIGAAAATATQLYASWQIYTAKAGVSALLAIGVQSLLLWGIVFTMGTSSPAESWVAIGALAFGVAYIAYSVWAMSRV